MANFTNGNENMSYHDHYEQVYSQDTQIPKGEAKGWIQWKGTDVCIDIHCACGHHGHFDGDFMYYYECPACKKVYAAGQTIKMIPLTEEQTNFVKGDRAGVIKTCELE
jgi:hypothetical protein